MESSKQENLLLLWRSAATPKNDPQHLRALARYHHSCTGTQYLQTDTCRSIMLRKEGEVGSPRNHGLPDILENWQDQFDIIVLVKTLIGIV